MSDKNALSVKEDRFIRLAEKRVNAAIAGVRRVSNLANKANYTYTKEQSTKIIKALRAEVSNLDKSFHGGSDAGQFKL